jgi:cell division transport system ATP-binding protein
MIRLDRVTKIYPRSGGAAALRDVTLHVAKGEFAFLTGPSGAGKSTILKLLYMEERPTSGELRISGYSSKDISAGTSPSFADASGSSFRTSGCSRTGPPKATWPSRSR